MKALVVFAALGVWLAISHALPLREDYIETSYNELKETELNVRPLSDDYIETSYDNLKETESDFAPETWESDQEDGEKPRFDYPDENWQDAWVEEEGGEGEGSEESGESGEEESGNEVDDEAGDGRGNVQSYGEGAEGKDDNALKAPEDPLRRHQHGRGRAVVRIRGQGGLKRRRLHMRSFGQRWI